MIGTNSKDINHTIADEGDEEDQVVAEFDICLSGALKD